MKRILLALLSLCLIIPSFAHAQTPKQESIEDYNARIKWFGEFDYGMFIHFGLYSVLGGDYQGKPSKKYSEWIMGDLRIPKDDYAKLLDQFNPTGFDADLIAKTAKQSGMKYLVITSKHHEGFCLWDSAFTDFDLASTPFKGRDILKELQIACKKHDIKFGIYYSILDWHHESQSYPTSGWVGKSTMAQGKAQEYFDFQRNQVLELIKNYAPAILWFDGDWVDWWSMEEGVKLYNAIRDASPTVITNNRVANRHFFDLDYVTQEQAHFDEVYPIHWEGCYTLNDSWGFKTGDNNWKTADVVYNKLKDINEKGGSLLLNVGPDRNGVVQPEAYAILAETAKLMEAAPIKKRIPEIKQTPGVREKKRGEK